MELDAILQVVRGKVPRGLSFEVLTEAASYLQMQPSTRQAIAGARSDARKEGFRITLVERGAGSGRREMKRENRKKKRAKQKKRSSVNWCQAATRVMSNLITSKHCNGTYIESIRFLQLDSLSIDRDPFPPSAVYGPS